MLSFIAKLKGRLHRPWFGSGIGSVLVPILGLCLLFLPIGRGLTNWSYDLPFVLRGDTEITNVIVVSLDERSIQALKQDKSAFDRSLHARLVKRLNEQGAKIIVFDIEFMDPMAFNSNGTAQFAAAMLERSNVVLAAQYRGDQESPPFRGPVEPLRSAAALGLDKVDARAYFFARMHWEPSTTVSSLSWRAASLLDAEVTRPPDRRLDERWLNYYSPTPFPPVSYVEVLSNSLPAGFSFSNKVVFVGESDVTGYVGEEKEAFSYPWTWLNGTYFHGVQIHALTFSNLVQQDWLRRLPWYWEALVIVLAGAMLGFGLSLLRPVWVTVAAVLIAVSVAGLAYLSFARLNLWFPWLIIVAAQVPMTIVWAYLVDSIRSYVERRLLERSLELYLSPRQVKEILKEPDLLKPGASEKTISILFSDIANFSKACEMLTSQDMTKLLNEYYEVAIGAVHKTGGTVMKMNGDSILAIWNAPQEQKEHQKLACEAAVHLNQNVVRFNTGHGSVPLRTRIGLHTGSACVGNIGSTTRFDYAAVGENVNMASRLEGLNKVLKTNILATRQMQSSLDSSLASRFVGYFRFKGLVQIDEIYEIMPVQQDDSSHEWPKVFAEALKCWKERRFREAEKHFNRTLELRPKPQYAGDDEPADGPSDFYLNLIPKFIEKRPAPDWLGEIDLGEK